jgi:hypothetical protein
MNLFRWLFSKRKEPTFELPPEFLEEDPPDWVIVLEGSGLPLGEMGSFRVALSEASRTGTSKIRLGGMAQDERIGPELGGPETNRLFVILGFSFPTDITDVAANVKDGLPTRISIYRREPTAMKAVTCNMAGWVDSKKPGPPAVEIGRVLLELQRKALPVP